MRASKTLPATTLDEGLLARLHALAAELAPQQLQWASGYLAGLAAAAGAAPPAAVAAEAPAATVLFATQTGNSRRVAEALGRQIAGRNARVLSVADYRLAELASERHVLFVVSTHGEGDPPDEALPFFDRLLSPRAPRLDGVRFAVFALGDSSYEQFCEVGRVLDARLEELGGERLLPRVDCDVEFEAPSRRWIEALEGHLDLAVASNAMASNVVPMRAPAPATRPTIDRDHPLAAQVLEVQRITGRGSTSDTFHVELATPELAYAPGDSLGVWHRNPGPLVDELLELTGLDGAATVDVEGEALSLHEALARRRDLTGLSRSLLERFADLTGQPALARWFAAQPRAEQARLLASWQFADLLHRWPAKVEGQGLVNLLPALRPRLYSIASAESGEEVHLTVARVHYELERRARLGAASNWLQGLTAGDEVPVYVERNAAFHLPEDAAAPILMVGAGTGVAPFRAFVEARTRAGATGANWLVFGHRHFRTDFLYQAEWQRHLKGGALSRLDVAFSRDRGGPRYVQHALISAAAAVRAHLESGGHVYVCGSIAMGQAVDEAVGRIGAGDDPARGAAFLKQLKAERRLHRDVY